MPENRRRAAVGILAAAVSLAAFAGPGPGNASLVSLAEDGSQGDGASYEGSVSNDGRWLAFTSEADNLIAGLPAGPTRVYLRDLATGAVELVSRDAEGNPGSSWSYYPIISANGRWIAYYTNSPNIAPGAVNGPQAVLYDRVTGESREISSPPGGEKTADAGLSLYNTRPLSGNGRWFVFSTAAANLVEGDANGEFDVFLADLKRGTLVRITRGFDGAEANGLSRYPSISPNGRWVVYDSAASNLVPGDDNGAADVFLYDVRRGTTTLVSAALDGGPGNGTSGNVAPSVSNSGRVVAFGSQATDLLPDGEDTNGKQDIFLRDVRRGTTRRLSVGPGGVEGNGNCGDTAMDPAGRTVTFWTYAGNLVDAEDGIPYDQVVVDVKTGAITRMLHGHDGSIPDGSTYAYWAQFSANGRWFAASTESTNIVEDDGNGQWDVFLVDMRRR